MGKLIVIKGANFSENALFKKRDFNILVAADSVAYVILNATQYGPTNTPAEKNGTVVTLDNTGNNTSRWFSFNPTDYVQELKYLNGAFSTWSGYTNDKIQEVVIKANNLLNSGIYVFFAPIYSANIIKRVIFESNICPYGISNVGKITYLKIKVPSLNSEFIPYHNFGANAVLDISGVTVNYIANGYKIGHASKIIVNDCTQQSITNLINSQSEGLSETYVQSIDSLGNTILAKQ